MAVQQAAHFLDVLGAAGEAGGDEVKALLDAKEDVVLVPLAHVGHGQGNTGHVHALVVADGAAVLHLAGDVGVGELGDGQADEAVRQQHGAAHRKVTGQVLVGDGANFVGALHIPGGEGEGLAGHQLGLAAGELLQTNFRALGVQQGGHGLVQLLAQALEGVQPALVLLMGAVRKVEASNIHAAQDHIPKYIFPVRGRAQGAHDFGFAHSVHKEPP